MCQRRGESVETVLVWESLMVSAPWWALCVYVFMGAYMALVVRDSWWRLWDMAAGGVILPLGWVILTTLAAMTGIFAGIAVLGLGVLLARLYCRFRKQELRYRWYSL